MMMRFIRVVVLAVTVLLAPKAAQAVSLQLGAGAHGWIHQSAVFDLNLGVYTHLARRLSLGGRFGVALATSEPTAVGLPLDLVLRGEFSRFYIEGLVGPWIWFVDYRPVRAHAGVGFGLRTRVVSVGLEAAYLDPDGIIGIRVAIPL